MSIVAGATTEHCVRKVAINTAVQNTCAKRFARVITALRDSSRGSADGSLAGLAESSRLPNVQHTSRVGASPTPVQRYAFTRAHPRLTNNTAFSISIRDNSHFQQITQTIRQSRGRTFNHKIDDLEGTFCASSILCCHCHSTTEPC